MRHRDGLRVPAGQPHRVSVRGSRRGARDFPVRMLRIEGARPRKVRRYRGFKEEVYLQRFRPDPRCSVTSGSAGGDVLRRRPSPAGAAYHQFENPAFDRALAQVLGREDQRSCCCRDGLRTCGPTTACRRSARSCRIAPSTPARSPLRTALLGAGGTMNREGALLGTPVFGMYAGRLAALDQR